MKPLIQPSKVFPGLLYCATPTGLGGWGYTHREAYLNWQKANPQQTPVPAKS